MKLKCQTCGQSLETEPLSQQELMELKCPRCFSVGTMRPVISKRKPPVPENMGSGALNFDDLVEQANLETTTPNESESSDLDTYTEGNLPRQVQRSSAPTSPEGHVKEPSGLSVSVIISAVAGLLVVVGSIGTYMLFSQGAAESEPIDTQVNIPTPVELPSEEQPIKEPSKPVAETKKINMESVSAWKDVPLILEDPGRTIVGLKVSDHRDSTDVLESPKFELVAKLNGEACISILKFLENKDVALISHYPGLASRLFELPLGQVLSQADIEELISIFRHHSFLPESIQELDFVTYRSAKTRRPELGLFQSADKDSLTILTINNQQQTIFRSDIVPGSVFRAKDTAILSALNEYNFDDYCTFNVLYHLVNDLRQNEQKYLNRRCLLVIAPEFNAPEIQEPIKSVTYADYVPSGGISGLIANGFVFSENMRRQHMFHLDRKRYQQQTMTRFNIKELLDEKLDQIRTRILEFGVPVLSQHQFSQQLRLRQKQFGNRNDKNISPITLLTDSAATHLLTMKFISYESHTDVTLSLYSKRDGQLFELWRLETPAHLKPNVDLKNEYFLDAGQIVELILPTTEESEPESLNQADQRPSTKDFYESAKLFTPNTALNRLRHLVYLEQNAQSLDGAYYVRSLFEIARKQIVNDLQLYQPVTAANINQDQQQSDDWKYRPVTEISEVDNDYQMRYLISQLLKDIYPLAGRIVQVDQKSNNALVQYSLNVSQNRQWKIGETITAMRFNDSDMLEPLPAILKVDSIDRGFVTLRMLPHGMEDYWYNEEQIQINDIVLQPSLRRQVVGVLPAIAMTPGTNASIHRKIMALRIEADAKQQLLQATVRQASQDGFILTNRIHQALANLGYESESINKTPETVARENNLIIKSTSSPSSFRTRGIATESFDADLVASIMYDEVLVRGATHVVGSYIYPESGSVTIRNGQPQVKVTRYKLTIGIRTKSQENNDEKRGVWNFTINQSQIQN